LVHTTHIWRWGNQAYSNEGQHLSPRRDKSKRIKILFYPENEKKIVQNQPAMYKSSLDEGKSLYTCIN
jgi:hypothetical protein